MKWPDIFISPMEGKIYRLIIYPKSAHKDIYKKRSIKIQMVNMNFILKQRQKCGVDMKKVHFCNFRSPIYHIQYMVAFEGKYAFASIVNIRH